METLTQPTWTDEALMALPDTGQKVELIDGDLVMTPAGGRHGNLAMFLGGQLELFARKGKLGRVLDSSTGFRMRGGNLRSPDVSFVGRERLRGLKQLPLGFMEGAPELAVEVLSPTDTLAGLHQRLVEYFESGTRLAWVVNPLEETVLVYRSAAHPEALLRAPDHLDGEDLLPGFELPLTELFADLDL